MTTLSQRKQLIDLVDESVASGARRWRACQVIGLTVRTLQRWREVGGTTVLPDRRPTASRPAPTTQIVDRPNACWTWDITWLPSVVRGRFYYLYLISDLYSRFGVHWEVHETECGDLAAKLVEQAMWRERCHDRPPILHSDNGSPMKSVTLLTKLRDLGIASSFSRPRVSDDSAFIESLFRTLKHGPMGPPQRFESVQQARRWVATFMDWYNHHHQHSAIRFVTPAQRHRGEDIAILANRDAVYAKAREANPRRWTTTTRNWQHITQVALNPDQATREKLNSVA